MTKEMTVYRTSLHLEKVIVHVKTNIQGDPDSDLPSTAHLPPSYPLSPLGELRHFQVSFPASTSPGPLPTCISPVSLTSWASCALSHCPHFLWPLAGLSRHVRLESHL